MNHSFLFFASKTTKGRISLANFYLQYFTYSYIHIYAYIGKYVWDKCRFPGFDWDRVNFPPSIFCGLDLV